MVLGGKNYELFVAVVLRINECIYEVKADVEKINKIAKRTKKLFQRRYFYLFK